MGNFSSTKVNNGYIQHCNNYLIRNLTKPL